MPIKIGRPSPALVVACIALAISLSSAGYAATKLPKKSVGTAQLKRNAVISAKVKNHSLLALDFKTGQLPAGPAGPTGATGAKGDKGVPGDPAIDLWAAFAANAVFVRGSGVVSTGHPSLGVYQVRFSRQITACAWLAEPASTAGVYYSGGAALTRKFGTSTDTVEVETRNTSGVLSDSVGFTLLVVC
jgi:hypothetical protein